MSRDPSGFAAELRRRRLAAGLSQEELASRAALSENTVGLVERAGHLPSGHTARRLADALNLTGDDRAGFVALAAGPGASAPRAPGAPGIGLPTPPTPLIGRAGEVAAVADKLRAGARLLTLTGSPGVGKTRVALAAADAAADHFAHGARFVALDPIREVDLAPGAIARALGVREVGGKTLPDRLAAHLRDRSLLLVLDNVEHIAGVARLVATLLDAAPGLAVLATGRQPLHLASEERHVIPSLAPPDAAELFTRRARAVVRGFAVAAADDPVVADICARLDRLPLAIELAAARVPLLPPRALRDRLARPLPVLTGGAVDAPARQRTLRDTIAWSHDLLTADERAVFRRLAPFAGGTTLAAAEAVCGVAEAEVPVLDTITALATQSLVVVTGAGADEPRLGLLETIREYALERLAASGEEAAVRARHADHFLGLAEAAAPHLDGPAAAGWLDRLDREVDNLRAALDWLLARGEADAAVRLAGALGPYWWRRGRAGEGRRALERALAPGEVLVPGSRLRALLAAGRLARAQSDPAGARANLDTALALARGLGDERGIAAALDELGIIAALGGAGDAAAGSLFAESLAIARRIDDTGLVALVLMHQGNLARMRGDEAAGSARYAESLALLRIAGNPADYGRALNNVGLSAFRAGDLAGAGATLAESLALLRAAGDTDGLDNTLNSLGQVALARDDLTRAEGYFRESLALAHEIGSTMGIARCLEGFAGLAAAARDPRRAARLFGAAQALLDTAGVRALHVERVNYDRDVGRARAVIGADAFAEAYAAGRALSPGQVTAETRPAA